MKAAIFSNHSPRVGFGVDRKMDVSRSQVMVVAASRNQINTENPHTKAPSRALFAFVAGGVAYATATIFLLKAIMPKMSSFS
jgi:hypothetical protein